MSLPSSKSSFPNLGKSPEYNALLSTALINPPKACFTTWVIPGLAITSLAIRIVSSNRLAARIPCTANPEFLPPSLSISFTIRGLRLRPLSNFKDLRSVFRSTNAINTTLEGYPSTLLVLLHLNR